MFEWCNDKYTAVRMQHSTTFYLMLLSIQMEVLLSTQILEPRLNQMFSVLRSTVSQLLRPLSMALCQPVVYRAGHTSDWLAIRTSITRQCSSTVYMLVNQSLHLLVCQLYLEQLVDSIIADALFRAAYKYFVHGQAMSPSMPQFLCCSASALLIDAYCA